MTPERRSQLARIAALHRWQLQDGAEQARRGQRGLRNKFKAEIRSKLPYISDAELEIRTDRAMRAHMSKIAMKSVDARKRRKAPS